MAVERNFFACTPSSSPDLRATIRRGAGGPFGVRPGRRRKNGQKRNAHFAKRKETFRRPGRKSFKFYYGRRISDFAGLFVFNGLPSISFRRFSTHPPLRATQQAASLKSATSPTATKAAFCRPDAPNRLARLLRLVDYPTAANKALHCRCIPSSARKTRHARIERRRKRIQALGALASSRRGHDRGFVRVKPNRSALDAARASHPEAPD